MAADFLTDYSNLAGAGSAFNSFATAFEKAQDAQVKRQETNARMESEKAKAEREADQTAIQAKIAGLQKTAPGQFDEAPLSPKGQMDQQLKAKSEGYTIQPNEGDPNGVGSLTVDKNSPKYIQAQNSGMRGQTAAEGLAFREHGAAVKSVADDKQSKDLLNGYQSINNALVNFKASGGMPQEFHQLQNSLRLNAGSGNRTGVEERSKGYASDWGISKDEAMQIMTGNISDVALSSPKMVKAIMGIADAELKNKQSQAAQQIKKKAGMYGSVYSNNPRASKFKEDFDSTVKDQYGQFGLDDGGQPQGLINPGLVSTKGLVGGAPANTEQSDPKIVQFAADNKVDYQTAANALKKRGYNGR